MDKSKFKSIENSPMSPKVPMLIESTPPPTHITRSAKQAQASTTKDGSLRSRAKAKNTADAGTAPTVRQGHVGVGVGSNTPIHHRIQPITEHSLETSEIPWLGTALPLDEWNDSGEYDEIIKKANQQSKRRGGRPEIRNSQRRSKNATKLQPSTSKCRREDTNTRSMMSERTESPRSQSPDLNKRPHRNRKPAKLQRKALAHESDFLLQQTDDIDEFVAQRRQQMLNGRKSSIKAYTDTTAPHVDRSPPR